ncbi:MAG: cellulase family glycosylhydrolase [Lachnospiraceae bacterium]|nr:cellulase family glycosylhydrolase [Lachnospiraceae bacterium]
MEEKENQNNTEPAHSKESGKNNVLGWKVAVAVLAVAVVLLGIKAFWPSNNNKKNPDLFSDIDVIISEEAEASSENAPQSSVAEASTSEAFEEATQTEPSETESQSESSQAQGTSQEESSESSQEEESDKDALYVVTYSEANTWEEGGAKMRTLELSLANQTASSVKNWTLVLTIEGLKSVSGWNGTYEIAGDNLTITPAEHNSELFANGAVYLGCNLGTKSDLKIKSATLNGKACVVKGGKVDQDAINSGNAGNQGDQGQEDGTAGQTTQALLTRPENAKQGDDWLHTDGRRILDKDGKEVWLTGVNWFGYNTGTNTFDGLWNSKLEPTVKAIADHGFNLIRVPFSAQLINEWAAGKYPQANFNQAYNTAMTKMNSLEIFEYFLTLAETNGIKVMIDIHSAETNAAGHNVNLWFTDKVSVEQYYAALEWMAERYKNNDTIIAYDLKNEPHGKPYEGNAAAIWNNSKQANNWKYVAETAASKVLAKNPNVLILVEGTEIYPKNSKGDYSSTDEKDYYFNWWGGNLRAVKDFPIDLGKYQDKLVYSPHDYGPTVYEQPWFQGSYDYNSLMKDCWHDNWFYIYENNTAPLLIGEWGGFMREPNLKWMTCMRTLISTYHLNHTFWCLNANSGDTGGLLLDDFTTWDTEKYNFVKEVLWQENGKFVGLDHEIPLGANGISVKNSQGLK